MDSVQTYKFPYQNNARSNERMNSKPVIFQRIMDTEWGFPNKRNSNMNNNSYLYDITDEYKNVQMDPEERISNKLSDYTGFKLVKNDYDCKNSTPIDQVKESFRYLKESFTPIDMVDNSRLYETDSTNSTRTEYENNNFTERNKYFQNIEPSTYFYSDDIEPINSNLGISYTSDIPLSTTGMIEINSKNQQVYYRSDPQLVRNDVSKLRSDELPKRNERTKNNSNYEAGAGTIDFENNIYSSDNDKYKVDTTTYKDAPGQINYYQSDIDIYKYPNYTTRSKIDYMTFEDPNGKISREYQRDYGLNDVMNEVNSRYEADSLYHRENLMASQMRKINSEAYQRKLAPIRNSSNTSSFTSNY